MDQKKIFGGDKGWATVMVKASDLSSVKLGTYLTENHQTFKMSGQFFIKTNNKRYVVVYELYLMNYIYISERPK